MSSKMSNTKLMVLNLSFVMTLKLVTFVFGMISSRIMLLVYGSELNGLVASINQFINYINLVELGLTSCSVYALYKPIAENNVEAINGVMSATRRYYFQAGYMFSSLVLVLSCVYPLFSDVSSLNYWEVAYLVIVLSSAGVINFFISAQYRVFLIANQRQYVISALSILAVILNTALIYFFGYVLNVHITVLKTICILTSLTPAIVIIIYTRLAFKGIHFRNVKPDMAALKDRFTVFINEIAGNIHFGSPIIILTFIVALTDVSVYSVYNTISNGVGGILNSIIVPIAASFGVLLAGKSIESFKKVYFEFEAPYYTLSNMVFAITLMVLMPFIEVYTQGVTDANYFRYFFMVLMIVNLIVSNMYNPQAILVRAIGNFKEVQPQTIIQASITIVLGIPLTIMWGICGVVIASIVANLYRSIAMIFLFGNRIEGINCKDTCKNIILSLVNFGTIILVCYITNNKILTLLGGKITSYASWVVFSMIISIIAISITYSFMCIFQREQLKALTARIISKIKK